MTKKLYSRRHSPLQAWLSPEYVERWQREGKGVRLTSKYELMLEIVHRALSEPVDSVHYSVKWRDRDNKLVRCQAWIPVEDHEALRRRAEAAGCKVSTLLRAVAEGEF